MNVFWFMYSPFDFLNGDFDEENNFMSLIGKLLGKTSSNF